MKEFAAVLLVVLGCCFGVMIWKIFLFSNLGKPRPKMPPLGIWRGRLVNKRINENDKAFYTFLVRTKKTNIYYEVKEDLVIDPGEVTGLIIVPEIEISVFQDHEDNFGTKIKAKNI